MNTLVNEIKPYEFDEIERRFQERWRDEGTFEVSEDKSRPKFYCLEMLPYPSGDIHVGHVRNYCITDVMTRFKRMRGFNVLHPIGWDALGLPAENAAIKRGTHPETWTRRNIAGMKAQLQRLGFSYAWSREIATCDPSYYRWNQWFFLKMLEKGIAYRANSPVNWCPSCLTVLANEQAEGGTCWRCSSAIEIRDMEQWFLRITDYQDALLDDMDKLSAWPERVLKQQRNWVGRSEGAGVSFPVEDGGNISIFTTRIDTIYGATFCVLAPEHPLVDTLTAGADQGVKRSLARLRGQDRRARLSGQVEKEGLFTGRYATNPFSGERIPIWVGNFVLMGYGTGAIMAVPAHDERDFEFARKYSLRVHPVIQPSAGALDGATMTGSYTGPGSRDGKRGIQWPELRTCDRKDGGARDRQGFRRSQDGVSSQGLAHFPPAVLGHTHPGRVLRKGRCRRRQGVRLAGRPTRGCAVYGRGRQPPREGRGLRQGDVSEVRRLGAPRDRHDGHVRRFVLVFLSLLLSAD